MVDTFAGTYYHGGLRLNHRECFAETGYQAGELYKESGRYFDIVPVKKPFSGKVYILADSRTSKTAEVLIYILKNKKIATIIGQKTAGAMMLAERITINNEYDIYLPVSEYYTAEGRSLNKIGIEPDIKVPSQDALNYVLKNF